MIYQAVVLIFVTLAAVSGQKVSVAGNSTVGGLCGFEATCSSGGLSGTCVSISAGCCPGGTVTAGLCPGKYLTSYGLYFGQQ